MHVVKLPSWYPSYPNDIKGVFFRDQAQALTNYGHKVGVVSVEMRRLLEAGLTTQWLQPPHFELDNGIATYRQITLAALPRVPYGNFVLYRQAARTLLARYIEDQGLPEIIHAHAALYAGAVAVEWGKQHQVPVVLTEHQTVFARGAYRRWQRNLANKAAGSANACIAVSPQFGELLGRLLPCSQGRWEWVPNVVAERFTEREPCNRKREIVRFLNLALMSKKKGQRDLLMAFARAFGGGKDAAELWLGGDGPIRKALEVEAKELGIASRVRFLGAVFPADVPDLLNKVDIVVVASHYETFGVVAAEALMAGIPVVATRCGGPECIVGEGDGRLVPPRNPTALARAMYAMYEEFEKLDRHAISQRARERFSGDAVSGQLTQIYERVLSGPATVVNI